MVRSKGEGSDAAKALFPVVPQLVAAEKYFDYSRNDIERRLTAEKKAEFYCQQELEVDGRRETAVLRLNINCESPAWLNWTVALKLSGIRIDGIDWESRYDAIDGTEGAGWHRHVWVPRDQNADRGKRPIPQFATTSLTLSQFLIRAFSELRITTSRTDRGDNELPFD
jgi:hypothetical protein